MKFNPTIVFLALICINFLFIALNLTARINSIKLFISYIFVPLPELALKLIDKCEQLPENLLLTVKQREENKILKAELERLRVIETKYNSLKHSVKHISEILNLTEEKPWKFIPARVIQRDLHNWFSSITIDKGIRHGITNNLPVIGFDNHYRMGLIGRTFETYRSTTRILLLTDPMSYVPTKIARNNETAVVYGLAKSSLMLDYLLETAEVKIGDSVITSGIGEVFPEGILVGYITTILPMRKEDYFKRVLISPAISMNSISTVWILVKR